MRDYQIASPSLEGVLNHDSLLYEGVKRPLEILRILDGPASKGRMKEGKKNVQCSTNNDQTSVQGEKLRVGGQLSDTQYKILQEYFIDLYGVFIKKLSHFLVDSNISSDDSIKLQAMLQEMVRVKKWIWK